MADDVIDTIRLNGSVHREDARLFAALEPISPRRRMTRLRELARLGLMFEEQHGSAHPSIVKASGTQPSEPSEPSEAPVKREVRAPKAKVPTVDASPVEARAAAATPQNAAPLAEATEAGVASGRFDRSLLRKIDVSIMN